ncbi:MAG TPA: OmpA family protein [Kofleriaceae bacterium]|jgi:chemotaxis protein MotB
MDTPDDPSGITMYPKMPSPPSRPSEPGKPKIRGFTHGGSGGYSKKKIVIGLAVAAVVGGLIGFLVTPSHAKEAAKAKEDLAAAQMVGSAEKTRADGLASQLDTLQKQKTDEDTELAALSNKAADVDKRAADLAAQQKKLEGTIDKSQGSVSTEGDEIHLKLVDKVLFPVGEDLLTDKGKQVLDKVAAALKELPDKQVYVQGHTDDQPIFIPPKKPDPKAAKPVKGKPAAAAKADDDKDPEFFRFHTNWELSAARALEVVHYLQDKGKVDPARLAAVGFGQYRPVSRRDKALNRRIEIVLYPKKAIISK